MGATLHVIGSLMIDRVLRVRVLPAPGETVMARSAAIHPGGKGANQALAAQRGAQRGQRVALVGTIGGDAWGEAALEQVRAARDAFGIHPDKLNPRRV